MKLLFRSRLFFIIVTVFIIRAAYAVPAYAAITLPSILTDTTLDPSITYVVDGTPSVSAGVTLTIPAGTHFIFTPLSYFIVNGKIIAHGTADNHIVVVGGTPPPFIPLVIPEVLAPTITQSPEVQTPDVAPLTVSNTVMMNTQEDTQTKHYGFIFNNGSTGSFSYADISDGFYALTVGPGSVVAADHVTINNADGGILGARGTLTLTNSTFTNTDIPVEWDFHGTFIHSNNSFSNTNVKGWQYSGDILPGETMKLDSTDGDYLVPYSVASGTGSIVIDPGVTVFVKDGNVIQATNGGAFSAVGTADKPITFYGDGVCTTHSPVMAFQKPGNISLQYINFRNLCSGIAGTQSTLALSHIDFDTVAGPAVNFSESSDVTADYITMEDIYQAFNISTESRLSTTNDTITTVNGSDPAIAVSGQTPASILATSIDDATTCIGISQNSSLVGDQLQLSHCSKTGLLSENDTTSGPSGITLTNSDIEDSGSTMNLTDAVVTNISNDSFHDDGNGVVLSDMPKTVLINNSWGSDTGPMIDSNPGGTGTKIAATDVVEVDYRPWIGMTAPPEHNPIIIVPGITGSVLTKNYGDDTELWPNIAKLALSPTDTFLDDLELLDNGTPSTVRPVTVGDIIRSAAGEDVFDGLIASLLQNGYKEGVNLFVLPYDWRLSNTQNQALLKTTIATALTQSGKSKVNIIAHSAGGLLVKDYLAQNPTTPIDHLFFIATPHLGAPKAYKALMYGDDMGYNFSVANALSIHVLNPARIKVIAQNMPAVYELLPSQKYLDMVGTYVQDLTGQIPSSNVSEIASYMTGQGRNTKMFSFAQALHDVTDTMDFSSMPTYNFVGCGLTKTVGKILMTKKESLTATGLQLLDEERLVYVQGDGTVPLLSASAAPGASNYYVTDGSHGTLPSTSEIESAINDILNGKPITASKTIASQPTMCAVVGDVVEIHSPVSLDIYDDQGRHVGPTADGDIEFGIPNVDYEVINDEKFAFLPSGSTYKIVTHAQALGSYDMYISHSAADDSVSNETYFNDVPLTSLSSTGTLTITPNSDGTSTYSSIDMDQDGDGTTDSVVAASSQLTAAQALDTTAPITTAAIAPGTSSADVVVTLTATDDNSGVLNTKYSTDDTTWNIYNVPFAVATGATVYFLSMDKAGNVESIKQVTVSEDGITPPISTSGTTSTPQASSPAIPASTDTSGGGSVTTINNTTNNITTPPAADMDTTDTSQQLADANDQAPTTDDNQLPVPDAVTQPDTPAATADPSTDKPLPNTVVPQNSDASSSVLSSNTPAALTDASPEVLDVTSDDSKEKSLPSQLLASALGTRPVGNNAAWMVGIVVVALMIIFISKRFFGKKSKE